MVKEERGSSPDIRPSIKSGINYDAWRIRRYNPDQFIELDSEKKLKHLTACATLAPNTHNTQPWQMVINPEEFSVAMLLDRSRVLPASDVIGRQSTISVGCATANLLAAAEHLGLQPNLCINEAVGRSDVTPAKQEKDERFTQLATINFDDIKPSTATDSDMYNAIFTRTMNRNLYDVTRAIPVDIQQVIRTIAEDQGVFLHLLLRGKSFMDARKMQGIAELQGRADGTVINSVKFARELGDWLLPNDTPSFVGMPGDTFGVDHKMAERIHKGLRGEALITDSEKASIAQGSKLGIESSPLVGVLTLESDTPQDWLKAGITLESIALYLESHGINMAILAGLAEVDITRILISKGLGNHGDNPAVLFRAGYAIRLNPHSPRLLINEAISIQ